MNNKCENCDYRKLLAAVFDIHISEDDCWLEECEMEKGDEELRNFGGGLNRYLKQVDDTMCLIGGGNSAVD